jgi:uncharacterized membrane protein YdjX (TVP38/TMEM64 family)
MTQLEAASCYLTVPVRGSFKLHRLHRFLLFIIVATMRTMIQPPSSAAATWVFLLLLTLSFGGTLGFQSSLSVGSGRAAFTASHQAAWNHLRSRTDDSRQYRYSKFPRSDSSGVYLARSSSPSSRTLRVVALEAISPKNLLNDDDKNEETTTLLSKKRVRVLLTRTLLLLTTALCILKRHAILSFLGFVKNEWLFTTLDRLSAAGPIGLIVYGIAFFIWEMTFGITTPVETAAGMAFGPLPAIVASGFGKIGGAYTAFLLSRYIFYETVHEKVQQNELLGLMEESIHEHPLRIALLSRFSPLPEFAKNCGMGVLEVPKRTFLASLLLHGGFFTLLWSFMGAETVRVMRNGGAPSSLLKILVSMATWIGIGAQFLIGWWLKTLKDKQQQQQRHDQEEEEEEEEAAETNTNTTST